MVGKTALARSCSDSSGANVRDSGENKSYFDIRDASQGVSTLFSLIHVGSIPGRSLNIFTLFGSAFSGIRESPDKIDAHASGVH